MAPISPRLSLEVSAPVSQISPQSTSSGRISYRRRTIQTDERLTNDSLQSSSSRRLSAPGAVELTGAMPASPSSPLSPPGVFKRPESFKRNGRSFTMSELPEFSDQVVPVNAKSTRKPTIRSIKELRSRTVGDLPEVRVDSISSIQTVDTISDADDDSEQEANGFTAEKEPRRMRKSSTFSLQKFHSNQTDDTWSDDSDFSSIIPGSKARRANTCSSLPQPSTCSSLPLLSGDEGLLSCSEPRVKSARDIDKEFEQLFAGQNPDWDPAVALTPPKVIEVNGNKQQERKRAPRRASTKYLDAVLGASMVDEIMCSERSQTPEPEEKAPKEKDGEPKKSASLGAVLTTLLFVRRRVARLRRDNDAGAKTVQMDAPDE